MEKNAVYKEMETINMGDDMKNRILENIKTNDKQLEIRYKKKHRSRMIKKTAVVFSIMVLAATSVYATGGKGIIDYFFHSQSGLKNAGLLNEILVHEEQTIKIDEYTFTLKQYILEKHTGQFYAIVDIDKENGKMEYSTMGDGQISSFLNENERFGIGGYFGLFEVFEAEEMGDTLRVYIRKTIEDRTELYENVLFVIDSTEQGEYGKAKRYPFDIKPQEMSISFKMDSNLVYMSPLGMMIYTNRLRDEKLKDIVLVDKEDKKIVVVKDGLGKAGRTGGTLYNSDMKDYTTTIPVSFYEVVDYTNIKAIIINGKEYEIKN